MASRILLVEDDQELGAQLASWLRDAGYEPTWWREGRRLLEGTPLDAELVILDLRLPGTYGLEVQLAGPCILPA